VQAVKDLNLTIEDGEFVTLVGPSGCGKSTTLNMLAGLEEVTSGTISIDGEVVNDLPAGERDVAMVFQNYALYPHMSVYDNLAFALKIRGVPRTEIDRKVREVARLLDIEGLLDRKPRQLSGGQRQRVALGRAIVRAPRVFLLDEPLSNLDAKLRTQMRAELKLLFTRLRGTVVYVTHDQAEAMTLSDRVAVFNNGVVQQVGEPLEIYERPRNAFVAGFVGSPPMNFLPAVLSRANGQLVARGPAFSLPLPPDLAAALPADGAQREVLVGVRPEDIGVNGSGDGIAASVAAVEPMGSENIVHFRLADRLIAAVLEKTVRLVAGQAVHLRFRPEHLHLFDARTEEALR